MPPVELAPALFRIRLTAALSVAFSVTVKPVALVTSTFDVVRV